MMAKIINKILLASVFQVKRRRRGRLRDRGAAQIEPVPEAMESWRETGQKAADATLLVTAKAFVERPASRGGTGAGVARKMP